MRNFILCVLMFFFPAFIFGQSAFIGDSTSAILIAASHFKSGNDTGQGFSAGVSFNDSFDLVYSTSKLSFPGGKSSVSGVVIEPITKNNNNGIRLAFGLGLGMLKNEYQQYDNFESLVLTFNVGAIVTISTSQAVDVFINSAIGFSKLLNKKTRRYVSSNSVLFIGLPFIFKISKDVNIYLEPAYSFSSNNGRKARLFSISGGLLIHVGH